MGKLYDAALSFVNDWKAPTVEDIGDAKLSIVIPVYKPAHLDAVLAKLSTFGKDLEVVLVDDFCGNAPLHLPNYPNLTLRLIRHTQNHGRPVARNTGAAYATGEILVFMDQDMILSPAFLPQAVRLLEANGRKGIALGLRHTLPFDEIPQREHWINYPITHDWRVSTPTPDFFIDLTVAGVGSSHNRCDPNGLLDIYHQTNFLRELGVTPHRTVGFWDLPSMVISHSMAIAKEEFLAIGGFPEWISGWGGEDIAIGFSAVAAGNPILMTEAVSLHIQHPPHSGSEEQKNRELVQNIGRYRQWATTADEFPTVDLSRWRARGTEI